MSSHVYLRNRTSLSYLLGRWVFRSHERWRGEEEVGQDLDVEEERSLVSTMICDFVDVGDWADGMLCRPRYRGSKADRFRR
jgi:hypothetical protein